jgi:anaerobic selenocysteine-containing dehydrogenase
MRKLRTACRCCSVQCGMIATIDADDRVLKVEGDREHPATRGYSCAKGRSIPERHHTPDRLLHPRLDGKVTSWVECLDDLGGKLNAMRAAHGPGAIGRLLGTGGAYDTLGSAAMGRLSAALGTPQCYSVGTVDTAPLYRAAQMVTGFHAMQPHWAPEQEGPSLVILLGANFCVSHGYLGVDLSDPVRKLREYRERGGEVWTVDPRNTKTAMQSDRHLALRPGSDVWLLAWLVREILAEGADQQELESHCAAGDVAALRGAVAPFTRERASTQTGLSAEALDELLAAIRRHGRVAVLAGTGIAFSPHGLLCEWLRWALLVVTGSLDREDRKGMFFNPTSLAKIELGSWSDPSPVDRSDPPPASRPDLPGFYGEHPVAALADEIEAGNLRALIVFGSNPLIALPEPDRVRQALSKLEALVVIDPFDTEVASMATHALPSAWLLERSDVRQRPSRIQFSPALVAPLGEAQPGWWIFAQIADRLGLDIFGDGVALADRDEAACYRAMFARARVPFDALQAAGVHGIETPRLDGWFHKAVLRERGWRIAPPAMIERLAQLDGEPQQGAMLVSGRVDYATNSMAFPNAMRHRGELPPIHLSADLAQAHGIAECDAVRIATVEGQIEGPAHIDPGLHPGTVWIGHGWSKRNVNRLIGSARIDPLTVQPFMSALPVRVARVG